MAKLFIYPSDMRLTPKLKRKLEDGGYIPVPEKQVGSIRVVEPLPDLKLDDNESLWLMQTLLSLVLTDSYSSLKEKLGKKLINRLQEKIGVKTDDKPFAVVKQQQQ